MAAGRRRFDDVPTVPMDELLDLGAAGVPVQAAGTESQRAAKVVTYGRCPMHRDPKPVALVWSGAHLSWREHTFRTWSGTPFTCGGSLQRLCVKGALYVAGEPIPHCPCEENP